MKRTRTWALLGGVACLVALGAGPAAADPADASRYPYDPVCAWGRLANGKGMLVRCITREEAESLAKNRPLPAPSGKPEASAAPAESPPAGGPAEASVTRVDADQGKLPLAIKKLGAARDKFAQCIDNNGGLSKDAGEVQVRFLGSCQVKR